MFSLLTVLLVVGARPALSQTASNTITAAPLVASAYSATEVTGLPSSAYYWNQNRTCPYSCWFMQPYMQTMTWSQFITPMVVGTALVIVDPVLDKTITTTQYNTLTSKFMVNGTVSTYQRATTTTGTNISGTSVHYPTPWYDVSGFFFSGILPNISAESTTCHYVPHPTTAFNNYNEPPPSHYPWPATSLQPLNEEDPYGDWYTMVKPLAGASRWQTDMPTFSLEALSSWFPESKLLSALYTDCTNPNWAAGVHAASGQAAVLTTSTTTLSSSSTPSVLDVAGTTAESSTARSILTAQTGSPTAALPTASAPITSLLPSTIAIFSAAQVQSRLEGALSSQDSATSTVSTVPTSTVQSPLASTADADFHPAPPAGSQSSSSTVARPSSQHPENSSGQQVIRVSTALAPALSPVPVQPIASDQQSDKKIEDTQSYTGVIQGNPSSTIQEQRRSTAGTQDANIVIGASTSLVLESEVAVGNSADHPGSGLQTMLATFQLPSQSTVRTITGQASSIQHSDPGIVLLPLMTGSSSNTAVAASTLPQIIYGSQDLPSPGSNSIQSSLLAPTLLPPVLEASGSMAAATSTHSHVIGGPQTLPSVPSVGSVPAAGTRTDKPVGSAAGRTLRPSSSSMTVSTSTIEVVSSSATAAVLQGAGLVLQSNGRFMIAVVLALWCLVR
ncbi:hypothetical protein AMS68_005968 [Peltaster fructicola]|uniref:Uncharacterized protein n=1 Tax=Peltaster fructicola TaxID=286661 RepID=A0A6H0Y0K3_9PEZI|nr:hypothetical protein AMS68_005968 [Peltaster fructicola]